MNAFDLRERLVDDYLRYTRSFIRIKDKRIEQMVDGALSAGAFWPDPLLQLNPTFMRGGTIDALVEQGVLHQACRRIFRVDKGPTDPVGHELQLHQHQREAIFKAKSEESFVLTSGTGSGKSLTYIVPIVDHVLRCGSGKGIQAIIVYPMNALANSQEEELRKFLEHGVGDAGPPVRFARYTGQEKEDARRALRDDPPDVLLTNYMMLELLLMRHEDRQIVRAAQGLRFLVFDELHTYRGRQGADVAMLIRRCREAFDANDAICVGTSATMASGGDSEAQKAAVAEVARTLFGIPFGPGQVIHESLERATGEVDEREPNVLDRLRLAVLEDETPPAEAGAFVAHPLASWIESTFGVRQEAGTTRLVRQAPRRLMGGELEGRPSAAQELATLTGTDEEACARVLQRFLLAGSRLRTKPTSRYPLFAFRLHQFLTRGDTVWATIEGASERHLELSKKVSKPGEPEARLFPLVFCRNCGTPYYRVSIVKRDAGETLEPREDRRFEADDGDDGYLYVSDVYPWPREKRSPELLRRLPSTMKEVLEDGTERELAESRKDHPDPVFVDRTGRITHEGAGIEAALVRGNFHFCLNPECGVTYAKTQRSERNKLATLGVDSRSTATTILALRTLIELRQDSTLDPVARKLLSFTDNRQDASLQAGHFNDFVHVSQLRSALYQAAVERGPRGLRHGDLARDVFDALALDFDTYAASPEVKGPARASTNDALKRMIEHHVYRDLEANWRVTAPNLEDCGLMRFEYDGLLGDEGVSNDEEVWTDGISDRLDRQNVRRVPVPPVLAELPRETRVALLTTLADTLRRQLCIKVEALQRDRLQELVTSVQPRLLEGSPWYPEDADDLAHAEVAYLRSRRKGDRAGFFLSGYGAYARFVKRALQARSPDRPKLSRSDLDGVLEYLMLALTQYGITEVVRGGKTLADRGFQLNADALMWIADDGVMRPTDPLRVLLAGDLPAQANPYFVAMYRGFGELRHVLEAREHTAQVPQDARQDREARFGNADLPLLFCSPTMELGVDIKQLNVVNLRNVPPTPANYAQRSGRAGRSGQQALVFTYCAGRSPHDQYFFREPSRMVAGAVTPPRIDLRNRDLIRSHVHAIWLQTAGTQLGRSLSEVIDLTPRDGALPLSLRDTVLADLRKPDVRAIAAATARTVLAGLEDELGQTSWWSDGWVEDVLGRVERSFEQACERWRSLYRSAVRQQALHNKILTDPTRHAEHRESRELRAQAESQMKLLTEAQGAYEGDFYSYRYLASEGFLPGYNFPRLPLSAYVPARRRGRDQNSYLSRPRFLAISEFGPQALVYHEGARYRVYRVSLDRGSDSLEEARQLVTVTLKRCTACGYAHFETGGTVNNCDRCDHPIEPDGVIPHLTQLQNVSLRLTKRITSDEEERQQMGYRLVTSYRFPEVGGKLERLDAEVRIDGQRVMTLMYGDATDIFRVNLGWAKRKDTEPPGFELDLDRGYWALNAAEPEDKDDPAATLRRTQRVVPYVVDTKNVLVMRFAQPRKPEEMAALQSAFKEAIQRRYQIEPRELACEPMPHRSDRRELLFFEASEGGAGVLRQLVDNPQAFGEVARTALEVCHYDPDTLEDHAGDRCGAACYECLLDYGNQPDHRLLDRGAVRALLGEMRRATVHASGGVGRREDRFAHLIGRTDSQLERRWLGRVDALGLRVPSHAQYRVADHFTDADFYYQAADMLIYIDGPPHDSPDARAADEAKTAELIDAGYGVIRFHHAADWDAIFRDHADVFGEITS